MEETLILSPVAESREKLLTELYKKTFPSVAKYIRKKGGCFDEAGIFFMMHSWCIMRKDL
jgi:hypothetical protein